VRIAAFDQRPFDPTQPEWMDDHPPLGEALEVNLENLRQLNRYFGAYQMAWSRIAPLAKQHRHFRWLDLACGLADIPAYVVDRLASHGVEATVTGIDFQPATLELAKRHVGRRPIHLIEADLHEFEPTESYDIATCFLALHHFSAQDAIALLRRMRTWQIPVLLIADLERSPAAKVAIDALTRLWMRSPETRHDAVLSIERAFSHREFGDLATLAGWCGFEQRRHRLFRQSILLR